MTAFLRRYFAVRKREIECRAFVHFSFCPRFAAVPLNDPPYIGKADPRSFKLIGPVQALEYAKEFIDVLHVEPCPVIADKELVHMLLRCASDFNFSFLASAGVFHGIPEKVLKNEPKHGLVGLDIRQYSDIPLDFATLCFLAQPADRLLNKPAGVYFARPHFRSPHPGKYQQFIDEDAHLFRGL